MAITPAHAHRSPDAVHRLVDRWALTGISPCCACTGGGRACR